MQLQLKVLLNIIWLQLLNISVLISHLIFAMTLVFGKQELEDVFQKKSLMKIDITLFLHFVTRQSTIAWTMVYQALGNIVQIKTKAVKRNSISSAMKAKPAYQMVKILIFINTDQITQ